MKNTAATSSVDRPPPPETLDGEALLEWDRVVSELEHADTLSKVHRAVLTLYAETWSTWNEARRHVVRFGSIIKHHNGVAGQNPHYKVMLEMGKQLRGLLDDLGLTPASSKAKKKTLGELDF